MESGIQSSRCDEVNSADDGKKCLECFLLALEVLVCCFSLSHQLDSQAGVITLALRNVSVMFIRLKILVMSMEYQAIRSTS